MKTLQEVKDEVAAEAGFHVWAGFVRTVEPYFDEVARRYAEEAIKEVAKIAKIVMLEVGAVSITEVNKETILNLINELK